MPRKAGARVRLADGIYRDAYGISAVVYAPGVKPVEQRFALDTELSEIVAWRLRTRADLLDGQTPTRPTAPGRSAAATGSLPHDAERFLELLPEGARRKVFARLLNHWITVLGRRPRTTVTRADVLGQLARWEEAGLSVSERNHRLRALRAFYRALDGEETPNPTTGIKKRREPHREKPRAIPMAFVALILDHVPDRRHARSLTAKDATAITAAMASGTKAAALARLYHVSQTMIHKIVRRRGDVTGWDQVSQSKIRLRVMAWTGMPHMQMERLRPQDVDLERGQLYLRPRRKGRGAPGAWVALLPPAVEALRDFAAAGLYGKTFSRPSMARSWSRAIAATFRDLGQSAPERVAELQAALPPGCRPYDLRHSLLTEAYRLTGDIRAVSEMAQHADLQTTKQYTDGAVSERVAAAIAKMAERYPATPPTPPAAKPLRLVSKKGAVNR